jgi:DMSO/TMAO reductase YedYZ heme-binding membrane subunit
VIGFTSPYLWYTSRATGAVSLVLLTLVMGLGPLVSTRVGGRRIGRFAINELHRAVSMIALIFVAIHVAATVVDTYVPIGIESAFIPFTSSYRRLPVAVGTVALDLMLAVWVTSYFKERLAPDLWRVIHWLSYLSFVAALTHGYITGTDVHSRWYSVVMVGSASVAVGAVVWRILARPQRAGGRTALSPLDPPRPTRGNS